MNNVAVNIHVHMNAFTMHTHSCVHVWTCVFNSFGFIPKGVKLLSHMITLFNVLKTCQTSKVAAPVYSPTSNVRRFQLVLSSTCYRLLVFLFEPPSCEVILICVFLIISWVSPMAQLVKNPPAIPETQVRSLAWEDALE